MSSWALEDLSFILCLTWSKLLDSVNFPGTKKAYYCEWSTIALILEIKCPSLSFRKKALFVSVLEAGLRDCLFAPQWGCAVTSPLQGAVRWFVACQTAWWCWRCWHPITVQRCCPTHALLCFCWDVGGALGAFDFSCFAPHLTVYLLINHMAWAFGLASFFSGSASCCSIGQWWPRQGPSAFFFNYCSPWLILGGFPWIFILLQEATFKEGQYSVMALRHVCFLVLRVFFLCAVAFPISPVSLLSSQSSILETGCAVAGLNSSTGSPFCLSILWRFGGALFSSILPPG